MADYVKPVPVKDALTAEYWQAASEGRLILQFCQDCQKYQFYPRPLCVRCSGVNWQWRAASGRGSIYTYTVVRQNGLPGFRDETPYILAQVELEEGVRLMTNIVDCDIAVVRVGLPVLVTFEMVADGIAMPKFRPATRV